MRILLVASLVYASSAIGADFRGTEFGNTCAAVTERETALGSEQLSTTGSKVIAYQFKGRAFDRDVRITYLCKDEALEVGDLHFLVETYDEAVAIYLAAYEFHVSAYGAPFVAFTRHGGKRADFELPVVGDVTRDLYYASWKGQGLRMNLNLLAHRHQAEGNWLVFIVASAAGE